MEITIQDFLDTEDADQLFHWSDSVFPEEGRGYTWLKTTHHVVARENGKAVGHIGFGRFEILGEFPLSVVGIGAVVVRPEMQGRHLPAKMFDAVHNTAVLDARGSLFALFCPERLVSYYRQHGYTHHLDGFSFIQDGESVQTTRFHLMWRGEPGLAGRVKIPSNPW